MGEKFSPTKQKTNKTKKQKQQPQQNPHKQKEVTHFNNFKASQVLLSCFSRTTLLAAHDGERRLLPSESLFISSCETWLQSLP